MVALIVAACSFNALCRGPSFGFDEPRSGWPGALARPADSRDRRGHEGRTLPPARRPRLTPPVYDPGHKSRFAVRINNMPRGQIIAQRQETHLPAIADDAMEQTPDPLKRGRKIRRETMKTMLLAAAAALSLGVGSAYADGGDTTATNTFITELPCVVAQADVPNAPTYAQNGQQNRQAQAQQAQNGQAAHGYGVYSTQSSRGTWLFPPTGNAGANS